MRPKKKGKNVDEEIKGGDEVDDILRAYICPNAGTSSNLVAGRQRLIFVEIDRNDVYSVLDVGKVADIVLMVMSAKETKEQQVKIDPDLYASAIDE